MARNGEKTGGGSRKGIPNKSSEELRSIIDKVSKARKVGDLEGLEIQVTNLFKLGEGVLVQKVDKEGGKEVFEMPPDPIAIGKLLDYRFGKAVQPVRRDDEEIGDQTVNVVLMPAKQPPPTKQTKQKQKGK